MSLVAFYLNYHWESQIKLFYKWNDRISTFGSVLNCHLLKIEHARRRKLKFISIKEGGIKQIKWLDIKNVKDSILECYVIWKIPYTWKRYL